MVNERGNQGYRKGQQFNRHSHIDFRKKITFHTTITYDYVVWSNQWVWSFDDIKKLNKINGKFINKVKKIEFSKKVLEKAPIT